MMAYTGWLQGHCKKHKTIIDRLTAHGKTRGEIIAYFDFENMVENEPDFCKLYKTGQKCHELEALNCFLCACPHFRFDEEGLEAFEDDDGEEITRYSSCFVNHKNGGATRFSSAIHQNCTACTLPHTVTFIQSVYQEDLSKIMSKCDREDA